MRKVRTSAEMSKGIKKTVPHISKADHTKQRKVKMDNPVLLKPVEDGDDFMIKF